MVATPSIDNSEWVMQGVIRDPITGALLRVNADGSLNVTVSPGGGAAGTGFTSATTAGTAIVGTLNSSGLSVGVPAFITTGRASNDGLGLNTAGTNITWTANSSGVSINAAGYAGTATTMAAGLTGTLNSVGLNLSIGPYITTADLSQNSSLYIQSQSLVGANTAGTTTFSGTRLNLSGGQGITLSGNVSTIVFSVGSYITTGRASTDALGLNTAGTNITWTANSSGVSINNSGLAGTATAMTNASATLNSAGLSLNIPLATLSFFQNEYAAGSSAIVGPNGASVSLVQAFTLQQPGSFAFLRLPCSFTTNTTTVAASAATLSASAQLGSTWNAVVYSLGTGANSQSLQAVTSGSCVWTVLNSISVAVNGSQASYTQRITGAVEGTSTSFSTQYSSTDTVSYVFSAGGPYTAFSGNRFLDINFGNSLSAGAYWLVVGFSSSSATNSTIMAPVTNNNVFFSAFLGQSGPNAGFKQMGSTNAAYLPIGGGSFSTNAVGTTNSIPYTNFSTIASQPTIILQLIRSA